MAMVGTGTTAHNLPVFARVWFSALAFPPNEQSRALGRVQTLPSAPTLLVVEDAHDHATLVGIAARRAYPGLDVRIVHEGVAGVAYLAGMEPFEDRTKHPFPDLVILDLIMPEVDGFAVLRWIRKHLRGVYLPVVVLTSSPNPKDERRARALGASAVYKKPAVITDLGGVVDDIVNRWIGRSTIIGAHLWAAG